jgi:hypothetical protein
MRFDYPAQYHKNSEEIFVIAYEAGLNHPLSYLYRIYPLGLFMTFAIMFDGQ